LKEVARRGPTVGRSPEDLTILNVTRRRLEAY
jgi:hypothetical protein